MSLRQRPLSPHLQVYRPQLTSVLSILHRATGIALSLGLLLWDLGYCLELSAVYQSGRAVVAVSVLLTVLTLVVLYGS